MKPTIQFEDFLKVEILVGEVVEATVPEGSKKLIRQVVDFGPAERGGLGKRVVFSGILEWYKPEDLVGKKLPYVVNLEPRKMLGEESQGMLLAAAPEDESGKPTAVLLEPVGDVEIGSIVM